MRVWGVLSQLLVVMLCAMLAVPAYAYEESPQTIRPHDQAIEGVCPQIRVWGSNEKILRHIRAVLLVSEKQLWGCAKCNWKNVVGSVVTYDYDAFGNLIHSTGATPNNYLFAGEQFDPDLGLYYNRARYLNVSTGRFWSMDIPDGGVDTPGSLHRYLYVLNEPVDMVDPSGESPLTDFLAKLSARGVQISARAYGILVHSLIENDIFNRFFPNALTEISIPGGRVYVVIFSGGQAQLYEIKPLGGTVPPERQIQRYLAAGAAMFKLPLVAGTLNFEHTIRGPFIIDKITYETAGPGVIVYQPAIDPPTGPPLPIQFPITAVFTAAILTVAAVALIIGALGPSGALI